MWCQYCTRWHLHGGCDRRCPARRSHQSYVPAGTPCDCPPGTGDGHRHAHCHVKTSPYRLNGGYVLREVGPATADSP